MIILHGDSSDPSFRCETCGANYALPPVVRRSHRARGLWRDKANAEGWNVPVEGATYCPEHTPGATRVTTAA